MDPSTLSFLNTLAGWLIVLASVVVLVTSSLLGKATDRAIADANAVASMAGEKAATANAEAATANTRAAALERDTESLRLQVAEANQRTAALEVEAEQARAARANAERELLVVRERLSDRTLTREQADLMRQALRTYRPEKRADSGRVVDVMVYCEPASPEACRYADEIAAVLKGEGWLSGRGYITGLAPEVDLRTGAAIQLLDVDDPAAPALVAALRATGQIFKVQQLRAGENHPVRVVIGPKPLDGSREP